MLHQWLFGYELPDTVLLLANNGQIYFLGTPKKVEFVESGVAQLEKYKSKKSKIVKVHLLRRNKEDGNAKNYATLAEAAGLDGGKENASVTAGVLAKELGASTKGILGPWEAQLKGKSHVELVDVETACNFLFATKDEVEVDLLKKSSVFSNKVMKHGFVKRLEEIIDDDEGKKVPSHQELANYVDSILEDPSLINLKVPEEDVSIAKQTAVCSGGTYDMRFSATSNSETLKYDIITISLGARYQNYCSHMARTFLVDPPPAVTKQYELLTNLYDACLAKMQPGNQLNEVHQEAVSFLRSQDREDLIPKLPKTLGFAVGLDVRNSSFLLNSKTTNNFRAGMAFSLTISLSDLELTEDDRKSCDEKSLVRVGRPTCFS